ncbi:WD40-repeat-containing domain protein [Gamsiella multidivaricata]|uniref:WD40-repeat-containing domain protein n=1 Tax=Gamsiella multidivaricata TaxID=101098 RepID=UPI00221F0CD6|nr:WD40-repeat-containing domain protein [Gamsiella multidivaricata]KAI7823772.1 WD40-repeat-containing domain protein [Gamsiella multidivaricata]
MHQFQSFNPPQPPSVAEYAFPTVLQFLQSEWRRFERDRNEWDIEKAEMKARIAFLEGEKRGIDNTKMDLMKRVKMLEYALRQERSKYLEGKEGSAVSAPSQQAAGVTQPNVNGISGLMNNKAQNRISTYSNSGQSMGQVSPTSATPAGFDPIGRAKSREFLRICLQEISYLTASVPQSIAMSMPPAPTRLARNEFDKRVAAAGLRNRKSDFFPANAPSAVPPALNRANSVPVSTLQSLSGMKPAANSSSLDPAMEGVAGGLVEDRAEDATLRQFATASQHAQTGDKQRAIIAEGLASTKPAPKPAPLITTNNFKNSTEKMDHDTSSSEESELVDNDDDPVTVVHAPMSGEQWHAQLQKAGQQLAQQPKSKKANNKLEDEAQLTKDVQDKFNISSERLSKMVKDWDKSKQDGCIGQKSIRKKKGKDSVMLDELANLSISEADMAETTSKESDSLPNEPPRWRPKVTLRRHMDTVRSIAFHPINKSLLSGSEDGTMKYWNLEAPLKECKRPLNGEIDPIHTYRGHTKAITAVAILADQNKCFSASMDSTVRAYKLAPLNKETYARLGHTDAVWDIRLFPLSISSSQLLGSISADGTLKIWDTETKGSPLKSSWGYHGLGTTKTASANSLATLPVPTGLDFCPTDLKKMVVSYSNSIIKLFDIETGKEILTFKSDESYDGTTATQINKIVCHPTLPLVVSGHEDRYIRFFDANSGACSFSMLSHLDAVSSLDIDPAGLVLCSGGHDASVRLWDIASSTRPCLQEFTGHRRKGDEGVCAVQYHPTLPGLLATGGADSLVKIFTRS